MTNRDLFKDGQLNLGLANFQFVEPYKARAHKDRYEAEWGCQVKAIPADWTTWTKIEVDKGSLSFDSLNTILTAVYGVTSAIDSLEFEANPWTINGETVMNYDMTTSLKNIEDVY